MKSPLLSHSRALVIGGAGFIGSHLCEQLVHEGLEVTSLDNYQSGRAENHVDSVRYVTADTNDLDRLELPRFDWVFHLGEYARVESSFKHIDQVFHSNIRGTSKVIEYCMAHGAKLIYAGSSTKFAPEITTTFSSPYALSKMHNTILINQLASHAGLPYAICYFHNVYGGREFCSGPNATLIGLFTEAYLHGQPLRVVRPGTQTRFFTHIEDLVRGLVLVAQKGQGDGYQIGSDRAYSILEVAQLFEADFEWLPERPGNRLEATIDLTRMEALGWRATITLDAHIHDLVKSCRRSKTNHPSMRSAPNDGAPVAGPLSEGFRRPGIGTGQN